MTDKHRSSRPLSALVYSPLWSVCLGSTLWNIKKITWAEHCSKWQANALGISKKTLRVKTYIYRRWSHLQTTTVFTIYCFFHVCLVFFFTFFPLFIVTCHMRSLDYKSTWTNCLYISMHSCFLIYILFTDSELGTEEKRINNTFPFMCFICISWTGNRKRSHIDLKSVQDMHIK